MCGSCIQTGNRAFTPAADIAAEAVPAAIAGEAVQETVRPAVRSRNKTLQVQANGMGEDSPVPFFGYIRIGDGQ